MYNFEGSSADHVWRKAFIILNQQDYNEEKITPDFKKLRGGNKVKEIFHVGFTINDPRQRIVFAHPFNPAYAIVEMVWILSGSNSKEFLHFWNPRISKFSDDNNCFHGAYGFRLGLSPNLSRNARKILGDCPNKCFSKGCDQVKITVDTLKSYPKLRQAVLQIWDKDLDLPRNKVVSKDIPCNLVSHLLIRDDKLHWLQIMRANDLIWGTPVNFIQFTILQEMIAGWLDVEVGKYNHVSNNLILFERHFGKNLLGESKSCNKSDLRINSYKKWEAILNDLIISIRDLSVLKNSNDIVKVLQRNKLLPTAYYQWMAVLTAESLLRNSFISEADVIIDEAGEYWSESWERWKLEYLSRKDKTK